MDMTHFLPTGAVNLKDFGAGPRPVETLVHACKGIPAVPQGGREVLRENMCEGTGQVILVVVENIAQPLADITHPRDRNRPGVSTHSA